MVKIVIGLGILISLYLLINPFTDPIIALSGIMIGMFLLTWGGSFFAFLGWDRYVRHFSINMEAITHAYKLSLLFGIYILCNMIFLLKHTWTVLGGIVLLVAFILIQRIVLPNRI